MKRHFLSVGLSSLALTTLIFCCFANAQSDRSISPDDRSPSGQRGEGREQVRRERPDPLLQLFDADGDNRLSFAEVDAIAARLKQGDLNEDGFLIHAELPRLSRPDELPQEAEMPRPAREQRRPNAMNSIDTSKLEKGTVVIHGGYETDKRDGGRPIVLIAAALNVKAEVFRDAFSKVRPARDGQPTPERVRDNKSVLMAALSPHGISNKRLDEVSDYYRYRPQDGELWTHRPARAEITVKDGQVTAVNVIDAGAGYSSAPSVEIVGYPNVKVEALVEYTTDLKSNGRIQTLTIIP